MRTDKKSGPGSEITCRSSNYDKKEPKNKGKDAANVRKEQERKPQTHEANPPGAGDQNDSGGRHHKAVRVQVQTTGTDSGSYQRIRPVPRPVSRSRARFPGEGRMRCAARS